MKTMTILILGAILLAAAPASAQIAVGGHFARAADAFGGTNGVGARVRLAVPLIPISVAANGEYFFADCDPGDCSLYGVTFDVNYRLPTPVLQPYAGIGWSVRKVDTGAGSSTESGINIGAGAEFGLAVIRPYVDLRYEFADAPEKQLIFRVGVLF